MPILSNTPTIRYITIQNLVIKDSNVYYPIVTTETSKKYIYWDKDSPYELICEDEMLEDRANLYLLVINKKGNFTIVNQDSISVNFDENIKLDGFNNKLNATVEKVDEHTKKFMSVTEDINGINKTVGTITEDLNETNEKLTNYKQTADQIAIDLQNTNKKYNEDKEFNKLRESIVSLLIDENSLLMELNSTIKDITRDNNFTTEEKTKVKETQSKITNKNDLLIIEVDKLVSMLEKEGLTDKKNQLTSVKEEYDNSFSLLNSTLNSLISGNLITQTQITTLINCISNVSTKLTKLKNICDEIIFLGTGGTLYEEIVKINITAGGIYTKISSIEENIKSNLSLEKGILSQHVKDLQTTVDKIDTIIKEIYIDGLVNQNEKDLVSQNLQLTENEHNDLMNKYNEYLSNEYLSEEMKAKLQGVYSNYINSYNTFVNELNTIISDDFFNESEKTNVDLKLEDYKKNIVIFHNNLSLAIDDYEENRYKSEIEAQKKQLQGEINEVREDLTSLNDNIEGTFKNNIIDESERTAIKQNIKNLDIQKANVDSQYNQLYKNTLLIDPLKTQFLNTYANFNGSYDTLLATLNEILNKDTLITQQDKINMDKCYADLVLRTTNYTTVVNQVVEFIANAEAEKSKDAFQDEIDDLQQQIDGIDLNIDGAFADGILSEAEKISLKNNLDMLKVEKVDVDNQYKQTYNNSNLSSSNKLNLKTSYDNYIIAYNALVNFIETLIASTDKVNDSHKTQLNALLKTHNDKLALYVVQYNLAIENISKSYTDTTKNALQQQIKGVGNSVSDLENNMNGVFQDSVLTEAEKLAIKERLQNLQVEKVNIDNQYNTLIKNVDLVDKDSPNTPKSNLKTAYNNLVVSYNKLVNAINTLLNIEGILDESHRKPMDDAFTDYKNKLGIYSTRVNEAIDAISKKRVDDEAGFRKEQYSELKQTVEGISTEVGKIDKAIDNISVIGNLVPNTDLKYGLQGWENTHNSYLTINEGSFTDMIDYKNQNVQIHFIYGYPNGQSDCQLIQTVTGKNILIDAGLEEQGDSFVTYLKNLGITRLDYVFATHAHSDHVGGMPAIINNFDIGVFYGINPDSSILHPEEIEWETMKYWQRVKDALAKKGMDVTYPVAGIQLSKYDRLDIYNIKEPTPKMNDMSLVLKYTHMGVKIVLSGDVEFADEERIASQIGKVDVLKLGHHGLDTSTGYIYLDNLKPNMTIMTTTANLTSQRIPVLTRLQLSGITKNITQGTMGTIVITSDGTKYASNVEKDISLYNKWGETYNKDYFFDWGGKPVEGFRTIYSYDTRNIDYYFENNEMKVGWIEIEQGEGKFSKWYYAADGVDGVYYIGELVKGFYELSWKGGAKDWYYFDHKTHEMLRSAWVKHNDNYWYYIKEHGEMAKSETLWIEDDYYTFDANGRMQ